MVWYALHADHQADIAERRATFPWLADKTNVTFEDMHATLRRELLQHRITHVISLAPQSRTHSSNTALRIQG